MKASRRFRRIGAGTAHAAAWVLATSVTGPPWSQAQEAVIEDAAAMEALDGAAADILDAPGLDTPRSDRQKAREHYRRFISEARSTTPTLGRRERPSRSSSGKSGRRSRNGLSPPPEEALLFLDPELQRMINEAYLRGTENDDWARPRRSC